jgi:hypothetical protein
VGGEREVEEHGGGGEGRAEGTWNPIGTTDAHRLTQIRIQCLDLSVFICLNLWSIFSCADDQAHSTRRFVSA